MRAVFPHGAAVRGTVGPSLRARTSEGGLRRQPAVKRGVQPGVRSKTGTPCGTWWKLCLSMVKITICGPP